MPAVMRTSSACGSACARSPFSHELGRHVRGSTGRQWVFDRIDAWLDGNARSRVFRIEGGPALGKTALALNLAHRARSQVIAVHLCRYNQGDSRSVIDALDEVTADGKNEIVHQNL